MLIDAERLEKTLSDRQQDLLKTGGRSNEILATVLGEVRDCVRKTWADHKKKEKGHDTMHGIRQGETAR